MNIQSVIILAVIILCVVGIFVKIHKQKKQGKGITCSGCCSACGASCPYNQDK